MDDTRFRFHPAAVSDDVLDAVVAKVAKLLRQARDAGATPAERATFEAKALALMAKHRIDATIAARDERDDEVVDIDVGEFRSRYGLLATSIGDAVAVAYSCKLWWIASGLRYQVKLTGHRSDAERARRLIATLVPQALADAAALRGANTRLTLDVRRSFLVGFAAGVRDRFAEAARMAEADDAAARGDDAAASTALVFVARAERVADAVARKHLRGVAPRGGGNADAHGAGYRAGRESGRHRGLPGSRPELGA
jgi:Protein of unknown function (DUF2786)